jgi:hypothetical protein
MLLIEGLLGGEGLLLELVKVRVGGVVSGCVGCSCLSGQTFLWRTGSFGEDSGTWRHLKWLPCDKLSCGELNLSSMQTRWSDMREHGIWMVEGVDYDACWKCPSAQDEYRSKWNLLEPISMGEGQVTYFAHDAATALKLRDNMLISNGRWRLVWDW